MNADLILLPGQPLLNDLLNAALIFAAAWLVSRMTRFLFGVVERRITSRTATDLDDEVLQAVKGPVGLAIWVLGLKWALASIHVADLGFFRGEAEVIGAAWDRTVDGVFFLILTLIVVVLIIRAFNQAARFYASRVAARTETRIDDELVPLAERLFQVLTWAVALIIVFDRFGIPVSSLLVGLGAGSLAFALAAQETLANMIGGFVIFVDRPFRVGDRILLENGTKGDVQDIGLRSTKILTFENTVMVVPNAQIIKEKVTNLSYPDPAIRVMVDFGVAYGTDLNLVKRIVLEAVRSHPGIKEDPEPRVYFLDFADSALNLRLVARTHDFKEQWDITEQVRMAVWQALYDHGVAIPFPQRDLWVRNWPPQLASILLPEEEAGEGGEGAPPPKRDSRGVSGEDAL
ncbi:MAG: mechanosensitive ion channel family protein [bacterium]